MPDQANDFLKDPQAFAQQTWDTWMRHMQQTGSTEPFMANAASTSTDDLLTRSMASLNAYNSWLQSAMGGGWQQPANVFGGFASPFAAPISPLDSRAAQGFEQQWQSWLRAMQHTGAGGFTGQTAAFGFNRETQLEQQAFAAAIQEYLQTSQRYQQLLQQVNAEGVARMQAKLAQQTEPEQTIESLKALYDLWVDVMEEAYADMAMSDDFREAFGAMVNAQMRVRQMQQKQTEQLSRELGMPTRREVETLGKRLQELRRELRAQQQRAPVAKADEVSQLKAENAALKRELAAQKTSATPRKASAATRKVAPAKSAAHAKNVRSGVSKRK